MFGKLFRVRRSDPRCGRGLHHLQTEQLVLTSPSVMDLRSAMAAASDAAAQRWLGWLPEDVLSGPHRRSLLLRQAGRGPKAVIDRPVLIAIDRISGRLAGEVAFDLEQAEVGGWLAPEFRGRGLGRELFRAAATFAHQHLGLGVVRAVTERTNTACVGALCRAGFVATTGPETYRLPDGRSVPTRWFRHDSKQPQNCH